MKYKNEDINGTTLHRGDTVCVVAYRNDPRMRQYDVERRVDCVYRNVVTLNEIEYGAFVFFPRDLELVRKRT